MKMFCNLPFSRLSIDDDGNVWPACCPDWVKFPFGNVFVDSWDEIWRGKRITKFRGSCNDGSLKYCDWKWCPYIAACQSGVYSSYVSPLTETRVVYNLEHINLNYDMTCNLKCPTCRLDYIHMEGDSLHKIQKLHNYVDSNILPNVESIALTGVGDPFMSQIFRKFLVDFNKNKYPNVKRIHLHTNGQLFNSKIYQKMKGLQDIELSVDISIDASTAETYSLVRPPGKWDRLLENLQFINSLPNIKLLGISMVVQQSNYREMLSFIEMGKYFVKRGREVYVEFKRPRQWNHLTDECFNSIEVDNDEFRDVVSLVELKRCMNTPVQVRHNLQEYL